MSAAALQAWSARALMHRDCSQIGAQQLVCWGQYQSTEAELLSLVRATQPAGVFSRSLCRVSTSSPPSSQNPGRPQDLAPQKLCRNSTSLHG